MQFAVVSFAVSLASASAHALEIGRAHLASPPGQPLVVTMPLRDLTAQDLQSLSVRIASSAQWSQAGLTPPAPLATLSVRIIDGHEPNSRIIELRSNDAPVSNVIDVLLELSSATTSRLVQSSVISRPAPAVMLSGQTYTVMRGDTLIDIARQFPVPGATLYQMLWALYQNNQRAFISENMNLLRAGASLSIPSQAAVLAVDPALARARYLAHVRDFRNMRGRPGSAAPVPAEPTRSPAPPPQSDQRGQVEPVPAQAPAPNVDNQVRLSSVDRSNAGNGTAPGVSSNVSSASGDARAVHAAADQKTSQELARKEEASRTQELERNVQALKSALAASGVANADVVQQSTAVKGQNSAVSAQGAGGNGQSSQATDANGATGSVVSPGVTSGSGPASSATGSSQASAGVTLDGTAASGSSTAGVATDRAGAASSGRESPGNGQASATANSNSSAAGAATDRAGAASSGGESSGNGQASATANGSASDRPASQADNPSGRKFEGSSGGSNVIASDSPVDQVRQWVSDNVLATGAIVLAFIALILAWLMRSSAARAPAARDPDSPQAQAFERRLKQISLDLDEAPESPEKPQVAGAGATAQTASSDPRTSDDGGSTSRAGR